MKITVSPSVILISAVYFFSGGSQRAFIPLAAALIHEIGHIAFAYAFQINIKEINLNLFGAIIKLAPLTCTYKKEAMLAAAGPITNIVSGAIAFIFLSRVSEEMRDRLAIFIISSIFFAAINLLPADDFDGGRILKCTLLSTMSPTTVAQIIEWSSLFCVFFLWSISVYFILKTGSYLSLFIFSGSLFAKLCLVNTRKRD